MKRQGKDKSIAQRVASAASARDLDRADGFTAYAMDRLLERLGRSRHSDEFILKGGVLVAQLTESPYRFTRDIDTLRKQGPADPDEIRGLFREIVATKSSDALTIRPKDVTAKEAKREHDGYDGVTVRISAMVGNHQVELKIDIGFGDAVHPKPTRMRLRPFLEGDTSAHVWAYGMAPVLAEKIETLLSKFPLIEHRLKDLLDVVMLTQMFAVDGGEIVTVLDATCQRRQTELEADTLADMKKGMTKGKWPRAWAVMTKEKRVKKGTLEITDAILQFDDFVRPLIEVPSSLSSWPAGGPWGRSDG